MDFVAVCFTMTTIYNHDSTRQTGKHFENFVFKLNFEFLNVLAILIRFVWMHFVIFCMFHCEVRFRICFYNFQFRVVWFFLSLNKGCGFSDDLAFEMKCGRESLSTCFGELRICF